MGWARQTDFITLSRKELWVQLLDMTLTRSGQTWSLLRFWRNCSYQQMRKPGLQKPRTVQTQISAQGGQTFNILLGSNGKWQTRGNFSKGKAKDQGDTGWGIPPREPPPPPGQRSPHLVTSRGWTVVETGAVHPESHFLASFAARWAICLMSHLWNMSKSDMCKFCLSCLRGNSCRRLPCFPLTSAGRVITSVTASR